MELFHEVMPAVGTCVVLGFTGSLQWPGFAASPEALDGKPHPLDRWSRRLIHGLAQELGAIDVYPSGRPHLPFQQLASHAESVHPSPIGLLVHAQWGLWHAHRGALLFAERIDLPPGEPAESPCSTCAGQPCRTTCPVNAFGEAGFALEACIAHVTSAAGIDCRDRGCRARRACPVGAGYRYVPEQMRFHMEAFIRSVRR